MSADGAEAIRNFVSAKQMLPNHLYLDEFTKKGGRGLNPLTLPHQRLSRAGSRNAIDIQLVRPDHPVHMDEAVISPLGRKLLLRQLVAMDQARTVRLPQRNMAGSIFIEERVEEEQSAGSNRRRMRHQRNLA